ncbi:hypothetical protein BUE80_DR009073 [Diplocarpon rosae]|nr:hypothetical protein BUE80_DR009073 [Diplocarpon rosae]
MKSSVLVSFMLVALCSAEPYCNGGWTSKGLSCCFDGNAPAYTSQNSLDTARKGCGDPQGGPKEVCDTLAAGVLACNS